jgi:hypothetical protein
VVTAECGQEQTLKTTQEERSMSDDKAPLMLAASAGFGAFLATLIPSAWPWHLELLSVLAAAVAVYVAANFVNRAKN